MDAFHFGPCARLAHTLSIDADIHRGVYISIRVPTLHHSYPHRTTSTELYQALPSIPKQTMAEIGTSKPSSAAARHLLVFGICVEGDDAVLQSFQGLVIDGCSWFSKLNKPISL
jgi:hypothetical protein